MCCMNVKISLPSAMKASYHKSPRTKFRYVPVLSERPWQTGSRTASGEIIFRLKPTRYSKLQRWNGIWVTVVSVLADSLTSSLALTDGTMHALNSFWNTIKDLPLHTERNLTSHLTSHRFYILTCYWMKRCSINYLGGDKILSETCVR